MSIFGRNLDLDSLVRRCKSGDAEAWRILVTQFSGFVFSVAKRHRLSDDDASDVYQQTFQALYTGIDRVENPEGLRTWLAVTASRISYKVIRNRIPGSSLDTADLDLTEVLTREESSAEEDAVQACEAQLIRDAIDQIGGRCSPLLKILYLKDEGTYQEASDLIGIPIGAIGPTRARCLEKLRKILVEEGIFT